MEEFIGLLCSKIMNLETFYTALHMPHWGNRRFATLRIQSMITLAMTGLKNHRYRQRGKDTIAKKAIGRMNYNSIELTLIHVTSSGYGVQVIPSSQIICAAANVGG